MSAVVIHAKQLEDGLWFVDSYNAPGCWADGETKQEAMDAFCGVFASWYMLKESHGDADLPPLDATTNARAML